MNHLETYKDMIELYKDLPHLSFLLDGSGIRIVRFDGLYHLYITTDAGIIPSTNQSACKTVKFICDIIKPYSSTIDMLFNYPTSFTTKKRNMVSKLLSEYTEMDSLDVITKFLLLML